MTHKLVPLLVSMLLSSLLAASAQQADVQDVRTRQLWDDTLKAKRPASSKTAAASRPASSLAKGALVGKSALPAVWFSRSVSCW
jgi:hypothetical protein